MEEKNSTPFGTVIEWIDAHIKTALEQNPSDFHTGYINGTINARNFCSSIIPLEKDELKKIYEAGQKNQEISSEEWFNANFNYKEHKQISLEVEKKKSESAPEIIEQLTGSNSSEIVSSISRPKRYLVFFLYIIGHFLIYTFFTAFYLITLQFKKLSRLPASAEATKNYFKDKLNL